VRVVGCREEDANTFLVRVDAISRSMMQAVDSALMIRCVSRRQDPCGNHEAGGLVRLDKVCQSIHWTASCIYVMNEWGIERRSVAELARLSTSRVVGVDEAVIDGGRSSVMVASCPL
jgi:hypothetical protein